MRLTQKWFSKNSYMPSQRTFEMATTPKFVESAETSNSYFAGTGKCDSIY